MQLRFLSYVREGEKIPQSPLAVKRRRGFDSATGIVKGI